MLSMGVYKTIVFVEKEVVRQINEIISEVNKFISDLEKVIVDSHSSFKLKTENDSEVEEYLLERIAKLKNYVNIWLIEDMALFQEKSKLAKEQITVETVSEMLVFFDSFTVIIIKILELTKEDFKDNFLSDSTAALFKKFNLKNRDNMLSINDNLGSKLRWVRTILRSSESGKSIAEILGFGHMHKLNESVTVDGRKLFLKFINNANVEEDNSGLSVEYFKKECNSILQSSPVNESEVFKARSMTARQLEKRTLEILRNTVLDILDSNSWILKKDVKTINIILKRKHPSTAGTYLHKSDSYNFFIEIMLSGEFETALAYNLNSLSKSSYTYKVILHELAHAFDYRLNTYSKNAERVCISKKLFGENFSKREKTFLKAIRTCRSEGLAMLAQNFIILKTNNNYYDFNIKFLRFDLKPQHIIELMDKKELDDATYNSLNNEHVFHALGAIMSMVIFLDSTRDKVSYSKNYFSYLINKGRNNLSTRIVENILSGEKYTFSIRKEDFDSTVKAIINKISLMTPEQFLERYEKACENLKVNPVISKSRFFATGQK
jgi:hypothetical protein